MRSQTAPPPLSLAAANVKSSDRLLAVSRLQVRDEWLHDAARMQAIIDDCRSELAIAREVRAPPQVARLMMDVREGGLAVCPRVHDFHWNLSHNLA